MRNQAKNRKTYLQSFKGFKAPSALHDDIQAHLLNTVKSNIQDITDVVSEEYRKANGLNTLPSDIWKPLRKFSTLKCAAHCEELARKLRQSV